WVSSRSVMRGAPGRRAGSGAEDARRGPGVAGSRGLAGPVSGRSSGGTQDRGRGVQRESAASRVEGGGALRGGWGGARVAQSLADGAAFAGFERAEGAA